jgi:hypothetical protein
MTEQAKLEHWLRQVNAALSAGSSLVLHEPEQLIRWRGYLEHELKALKGEGT